MVGKYAPFIPFITNTLAVLKSGGGRTYFTNITHAIAVDICLFRVEIRWAIVR